MGIWNDSYDTWKTRSPDDDRPDDDEEEDRTPSEAEFAIIEAERAYATLVQWHGQDAARLILFRIMRKMGNF